MKNYIFILTALFFISVSCNQSKDKASKSSNEEISEKGLSLKGTWERTSFFNYMDGKIIDTINSAIENKHIKIFTDSKVMWCRHISSDSTDWFGYGSYQLKDNVLTEVLDYGSKAMSVHIANDNAFVFNITLTKDTFSQVRVDEEGLPVFSENYVRLE